MSIIISSNLRLFYLYKLDFIIQNEVFVIIIPLVKRSLQLETTTKVGDFGKDHQSGRLVPFWEVYYDKSLWFERESISKVTVEFGFSRDWKKSEIQSVNVDRMNFKEKPNLHK